MDVFFWRRDWKPSLLLETLALHFYGETPLRLVAGRERIYFEHFGMTLRVIRTSLCRRLIDASTPDHMPNLGDACGV